MAYCDDETTQAVFVRDCLKRWQEETKEIWELSVYGSAEEMLFEHPDSFPFDVILLDVEMDVMNGIQLAKKIRMIDSRVVIAFLSNKKEYVFEGYEVQAVRYLLKPIQYEEFSQVLKTAGKKESEARSVVVNVDGELRKVYERDICYIEAVGHYIHIHTQEEELVCKVPLANLYPQLNGEQFIYTHRSYIVNIKYVTQIKRSECILEDHRLVPVSRLLYRKVNEAFIQYYQKEYIQ